ncbi:MAG: glutaredoxin family protein [Nitriliruptoraceae bacterium]
MRRQRRQSIAVVLYTRYNCDLCDQADELIVREARGCTYRIIDIDGDDELVKRYGIRIPVVSVNGQDVAEGALALGVVRAAVRAAVRTQRSPDTKPGAPRWRFWA